MLSPAVNVPLPERRSPFHSAVPFAGIIVLLQFETLLHVGVPFHSAGATPSTGAIPVAWRRSNISRTAIEPSPMAVATRLTDRLRTSPTQKTPGRLVLSSNGPCSPLSTRATRIYAP